MSDAIEPFRLAVPQAELDDLRGRLSRTRWPDRETVDDTSQGSATRQDPCPLAIIGATDTTGGGARRC